MSFTGNTESKPDSTTLALWSAAESGAPAELEALLPRVADINARNEHGVTALMRAAQHGHAKVVRLLLANGADANVIRNDKFTALSLAAFFGHTEVVKVLMEHGADSKASTRHGTSPHMWARARTFKEVVDQLKKPAPPEIPEPVIRATIPAGAEIQEFAIHAVIPAPPVTTARAVYQIHEAPKGFNARSPVVTRLRSVRLTLRMATAAVLIGVCVVGVLVLRGVHARSEVTAEQQLNLSVPAIKTQNEPAENVVQPAAVIPPAPATTPSGFVAPPVETVAREEVSPATGRVRSSHSRIVRLPRVEAESVEQNAATTESIQKSEASSEKPDVKVHPAATSRARVSSPLSPQLITPAKNVSPKTKVIQWP
jgi:hypothetical protein